MAIYVDDDRHMAAESGRFVQKSRQPESGQDFVAEFAYTVAFSRDGIEPFGLGRQLAPARGLSAKHNAGEDAAAQFGRLPVPFGRRSNGRHGLHARSKV